MTFQAWLCLEDKSEILITEGPLEIVTEIVQRAAALRETAVGWVVTDAKGDETCRGRT